MSKLVTGSRPCEVAAQSALATIQIPLPLSSVLMDEKQGLLDGIHFHEHLVLIALGIDAEGQKHILRLREGTTEKPSVARSLLEDLVERGLSMDRPPLFVIDGAKGLRKAITARTIW